MDGLFRRPSGVYFARLVVPTRLRLIVGQTELIASTGVRELGIARIVAGELIAQWRRRLLNLDRLGAGVDVDILRLTAGSPALAAGTGYLPLTEAAAASGLGEDSLLRAAASGRLHLYSRVHRVKGALVPFDALQRNPAGGWDVPQPTYMPPEAEVLLFAGIVQVLEAELAATHLLAGDSLDCVLFGLPSDPRRGFAPDDALALTRGAIEVLATEVESLRRQAAALVTPEQVALATTERGAQALSARPHDHRPLRDSIEPYLSDHKGPRGQEQTRRIRDACNLFLELMGPDLRGCDLNRELSRKYRDQLLPTVPANENKIRLTHKTASISESIRAVEGGRWPRMSAEEQVKRMNWLSGWLEWVGREGWAEPTLIEGIAGGGIAGRKTAERRKSRKDQDRRDPFTVDELGLIFGADWFRQGKGKLTLQGTYRTWTPAKTWVPLIGLLTGARLGEIAQLNLADIWQNEHGIWLFDVIDGSDDDEDGKVSNKRLKNAHSKRQIPVHPELIRIGLLSWRDTLQQAGNRRLFPELKYDENKGYGKSFTKTFSAQLKCLGLPRNGRKVFHSFRHNMADKLLDELEAAEVLAKQVLGHERGDSVTVNTYRKDVKATGRDSKLVRLVSSVKYDCLDQVASFDPQAGMQAVTNAMARKNRGQGAVED